MTRLATLKPRLQTAKTSRLGVITSDSWRSGKTTTERGYGYRWQKAREAHLRRHPLCVMCEAQGRITAATVVDHKTPHRGDQALFWNQANWQSLCATHHSSDKQIEEEDGEPRTTFDAGGRVIWGGGGMKSLTPFDSLDRALPHADCKPGTFPEF